MIIMMISVKYNTTTAYLQVLHIRNNILGNICTLKIVLGLGIRCLSLACASMICSRLWFRFCEIVFI